MLRGVVLLGFRGAGKSTIGSLAASKWNLDFMDTDRLLEEKLGMRTYDFILSKGEPAFRESEFAMLESLDLRTPAVIALGGGVVEYAPSRELVAALPYPKVCLKVSADELWKRLLVDPNRLAVGKLDSLERLTELLARREPLYEDLANIVLPNVKMDPHQALGILEARLKEL